MNSKSLLLLCYAFGCSLFFSFALQAQKLSITTPIKVQLTLKSEGAYVSAPFTFTNACSISDCPMPITKISLLDAAKNRISGEKQGNESFLIQSKDFGKTFYIRCKVIDDCKAVDSVDVSFVPQGILPNIKCYDGLSADLMPTTGEVWVSAEQFLDYGKIGASDLRIERGKPSNNYAFGKDLPIDKMIPIGCVGIAPIRVWAKYAEWEYCDTYIDIQNNMGATPKEGNCYIYCGFMSYAKGTVTTSNGKLLQNVIVKTNSSKNVNPFKSAVKNGYYSTPIPHTLDIKVSAEKNDNPINGVSTFDLVLVSKHILGTQIISDKFALKAADVNNSGKISTSDIVELRKMLLGTQKDFNNNKSWRFFDKNMNEEVSILKVVKDTIINFTAVKVGDINGNANPASSERQAKQHNFYLKNRFLKAGKTCEITWNEGDGFGFTMRYLTDNLELVSLDENSALLENGLISTVQIGTTFKAVFKAKNDIWLQDALSLNSDVTKAEFVQNNESFDLDLQFEGKNLGLKLFQNQPNPFHQSTLIRFQLPHNEQISISITDISGKEIKTIEGNFSEGYNEIPLELDAPEGLYFCNLKTANESAVIKIFRH